MFELNFVHFNFKRVVKVQKKPVRLNRSSKLATTCLEARCSLEADGNADKA